MWTGYNFLTALKILHHLLVLRMGLIYPQRTCCGDFAYLPASPCCTPQPHQALGFEKAATMKDFFLSFLSTHSRDLVLCVGASFLSPTEEHICSNCCNTEAHTSDLSKGVEREQHLRAILPCLEEQLPLCSTEKVRWQNA